MDYLGSNSNSHNCNIIFLLSSQEVVYVNNANLNMFIRLRILSLVDHRIWSPSSRFNRSIRNFSNHLLTPLSLSLICSLNIPQPPQTLCNYYLPRNSFRYQIVLRSAVSLIFGKLFQITLKSPLTNPAPSTKLAIIHLYESRLRLNKELYQING